MIEGMRNWIINICTIVIFITAIEMILPSNSMKKYGKFVLGLILITVIIRPLISLVSGNMNLDKYIGSTDKYFNSESYEKNYEKYKNQNIEQTTNNFKQNLEIIYAEKLKEQYPDHKFNVVIGVTYDSNINNFSINTVEIGIQDRSVNKIKEVKLGEESINVGKKIYLNDDSVKNIKTFLNSEFKVSPNIINIYKM